MTDAVQVARLFDGRRLTFGRQLQGLRKNALAERIGKTPTAVAGYENGTTRPAPATVARLALVLGVDPDFFLPGPAAVTATDQATPHFRSLRSTTQLCRDQAHAYAKAADAIAIALERHVELPDQDVPGQPVSPDQDPAVGGPESAARELRRAWNISSGPLPHLVRLVERRGVVVAFCPEQAAAVDAYSYAGTQRQIILLNPAKDDYYRQRLDVAHELGHLVMHAESEPGGRSVESQAQRFAGEFLMPAEDIGDELPPKADFRRLAELKEQWGVSMQALLFRAKALQVMRDTTYRNAMITLSSNGWRRREPGVMPSVERPSTLPRSVEMLSDSGLAAAQLAAEARVPQYLFEVLTARRPSKFLMVAE